MKKLPRIRIGISGWRYRGWRGVFYPAKLAQRKELAFAAETFSSVEINGTFYSLQRPSSFARWAAETPDDFQFAVKGPRYITHFLKLKDVQAPLANFFASGVLLLGKKLGPFLWQFPPNFRFDQGKLGDFLERLPRDIGSAQRLAKKHEKWLRGDRVSFESSVPDHCLRHAVEIRHESFVVPEFTTLLRKHDVALVCADTVEWPRITDVTSDFIYCRLHGSEELYASGYDAKALEQWAAWIRLWARGDQPAENRISSKGAPRKPRDVYLYFDNDAKVRAPFDALELRRRVDPERSHAQAAFLSGSGPATD
jgi:uncharacterized protein YecE (DUF72 family)